MSATKILIIYSDLNTSGLVETAFKERETAWFVKYTATLVSRRVILQNLKQSLISNPDAETSPSQDNNRIS